MNTEKVTRFEVIDHRTNTPTIPGRILVMYGVKIEAQLQDNDKTLKIFITDEQK